jgi:tripartite-type tricarboxylate transporter receptor subunit TctC
MSAQLTADRNIMKLLRRRFLHLAAGAAAVPAASRLASALDYPSRPVRIVVGLPAGLAPDFVARLVGQSLSDRLGQSFVIDNRPGAAGNLAAEMVARAPPDGYELLLVILAYAANATLYANLDFNFSRDIVPVATIGSNALFLAINPSLPAKTIPDFIAYAKARPGKINMASPGVGTAPYLFGVLFEMMTGVDFLHVPYRDNYMPDLLSGQVQAAFPAIAPVFNYIRTGKLRALAVTTAKRSDLLPSVPSMSEFVPGYEASGWFGIGAPRGTAAAIVDKLSGGINAVIADPGIRVRLAAMGIEPMSMAPGQFAKFIAVETDKWARVIKFAGIKLK